MKIEKNDWDSVAIVGIIVTGVVSVILTWFWGFHYGDKGYRYCMTMGESEYGHVMDVNCEKYLGITK